MSRDSLSPHIVRTSDLAICCRVLYFLFLLLCYWALFQQSGLLLADVEFIGEEASHYRGQPARSITRSLARASRDDYYPVRNVTLLQL